MFKDQKFNYAVFGNPIKHSKSPMIHSFFSKQTGILHTYNSIHVPLKDFRSVLCSFFEKYGQGANVTAPFKREAYSFSTQLTERAKIAQSVNTLKKVDNQYLLGDNTDGIGLLSDLIRLNFIKKNYSILILGAGGAVQGVLFSLLSFGCSVFILNRTIENSKKIVLQFRKYGNINIFNQELLNIKYFDLIINARSIYTEESGNVLPLSLISSKTCFYDMNYQIDNTFFIDWCIKIGATYYTNGIGMLVFQAAHSYFLWHNILPETNYIIEILNKKNNMEFKDKLI
ncbi:shikimate dehydrogenase [Buchnera aphidicola (Hyperomyzus lactucae)]|uniref:Shikimate dehydrogenase (NADP(+)) n=1 Tax=Buchnera aphidicola (Hyperomyzus lactucae) TaxID=1241860 RepID=A0A4D6Y5G2_9GAMM|nr:shikimate dehydrogenase [Buchnera aphidicola]QCI21201.1 shikimate dehydrogenase [Buchnera aphidicola (Hyperomyzus lactucae)]